MAEWVCVSQVSGKYANSRSICHQHAGTWVRMRRLTSPWIANYCSYILQERSVCLCVSIWVRLIESMLVFAACSCIIATVYLQTLTRKVNKHSVLFKMLPLTNSCVTGAGTWFSKPTVFEIKNCVVLHVCVWIYKIELFVNISKQNKRLCNRLNYWSLCSQFTSALSVSFEVFKLPDVSFAQPDYLFAVLTQICQTCALCTEQHPGGGSVKVICLGGQVKEMLTERFRWDTEQPGRGVRTSALCSGPWQFHKLWCESLRFVYAHQFTELLWLSWLWLPNLVTSNWPA